MEKETEIVYIVPRQRSNGSGGYTSPLFCSSVPNVKLFQFRQSSDDTAR